MNSFPLHLQKNHFFHFFSFFDTVLLKKQIVSLLFLLSLLKRSINYSLTKLAKEFGRKILKKDFRITFQMVSLAAKHDKILEKT